MSPMALSLLCTAEDSRDFRLYIMRKVRFIFCMLRKRYFVHLLHIFHYYHSKLSLSLSLFSDRFSHSSSLFLYFKAASTWRGFQISHITRRFLSELLNRMSQQQRQGFCEMRIKMEVIILHTMRRAGMLASLDDSSWYYQLDNDPRRSTALVKKCQRK